MSQKIRKYVIKRLLEAIPTVFVVLLVNFVIVHMAPGDPALILAGEQAISDKSFVDAIRQKYGLDKPLYEQFLIYLANLLRLDLGESHLHMIPVSTLIATRMPNTLILTLSGQFFGIVLGVLLGVYAAKKHLSRADTIISFTSLALYSIPVFWLGMVLLLVFGLYLRWFPMGGMASPVAPSGLWSSIVDVLTHLFLPVVALSLIIAPSYLRITRASVIQTMKEEFAMTARAIGYDENIVFYKHILRNALLPVVTMAGLWLGFAFGGSLMTEVVFSWPGLGGLTFGAIGSRDYPILMGVFLVAAVSVVFAGIITDVCYSLLDPRIEVG